MFKYANGVFLHGGLNASQDYPPDPPASERVGTMCLFCLLFTSYPLGGPVWDTYVPLTLRQPSLNLATLTPQTTQISVVSGTSEARNHARQEPETIQTAWFRTPQRPETMQISAVSSNSESPGLL